MKNQTNTTIKYNNNNNNNNRHTNLSTNKYYKRFITKAVSMIAIPIMTVSMLPSFALADDDTAKKNVSYNNLIDNQTVSNQVSDSNSISNSQTHTIYVNLSTIEMSDPYATVLEYETEIPEPTNDVTTYTMESKSVQYDSKPEQVETNVETENNSQTQPTSTYRYANLVSLTNDERYLAYCIIAGEVGSCSYRDKLFVAEALYNAKVRCKLSGHKYSLSHVRSEYGYEGYKDFNAFKQECINCGVNYYEDIIKAVNEVFDNFNMPSQDFVLFFHSGYSKWHQNASTIYLVEDTGAHKYYALKAVPEI